MLKIIDTFTLMKEPVRVGSLDDSNAIQFNISVDRINGITSYYLSVDNVKKDEYMTQLMPYESLFFNDIHSCKRRTSKQDLLMYDSLKEKLNMIVEKYNEKYKNRKITVEELEKLFFN